MKNKRENGELVVEASIIVTLVVIIISIMLYVGMVMYQQTLISVMANQTAANISMVYSNNLKDPFTGYVDVDNLYQNVTYTSMKTDAYMTVIENKANIFAKYRVKSSRILAEESTSVEVDVVTKPNELLKSQIVITIRDAFELPLVSMFGVNNRIEFAAQGRADCVDILEYINGVAAIGDPSEYNLTPMFDDTCMICFVPQPDKPDYNFNVPVRKGYSIMSSNEFTGSTMPSNPVNGTFIFSGWVDSNGTPFTATTQVNTNIVVYGSWKCTVTLNADGGTVNNKSVYTFTVPVGSRTSLATPVKSGYASAGWYTGKNGSGTRYISNDSIIKGDITLYPKWECTHTFKLISSTAGTCVKRGVKKYKCERCPVTKTENGSYGGHNYQHAGKSGYWCFEYSDLYRCSNCGSAYTSRCAGGQHNNVRRCNAYHSVGKYTFRCSRYNYVAGRDKCPTTTQYHVTCEFCGNRAQKTTYYNGRVVTTNTYWCGIHGAGTATTGCGHSGTRM